MSKIPTKHEPLPEITRFASHNSVSNIGSDYITASKSQSDLQKYDSKQYISDAQRQWLHTLRPGRVSKQDLSPVRSVDHVVQIQVPDYFAENCRQQN